MQQRTADDSQCVVLEHLPPDQVREPDTTCAVCALKSEFNHLRTYPANAQHCLTSDSCNMFSSINKRTNHLRWLTCNSDACLPPVIRMHLHAAYIYTPTIRSTRYFGSERTIAEHAGLSFWVAFRNRSAITWKTTYAATNKLILLKVQQISIFQNRHFDCLQCPTNIIQTLHTYRPWSTLNALPVHAILACVSERAAACDCNIHAYIYTYRRPSLPYICDPIIKSNETYRKTSS